MSDLESQLRASLPGERSTEVQDYAALWSAREKIELAIRLLTDARAAVSVVLGADRPACDHATQGALLGAKAKLDLDRAIKAHPAGKSGKAGKPACSCIACQRGMPCIHLPGKTPR